jgi:hypothetical protein
LAAPGKAERRSRISLPETEHDTLGKEMNPSEVGEALQEMAAESPADAPTPAPMNQSWLRLAYALEFFIGLIAIISLWSEIGGESHLDLMPWYVKLGCILGLDWCCVRFTAGIVQQEAVWTRRTIGWFFGIVLFCIAMAGITYYYHLHEQPGDADEDTTAAAVNIHSLGIFFYHANNRTRPAVPVCFVARSAGFASDRIPIGSYGGDPGVRV